MVNLISVLSHGWSIVDGRIGFSHYYDARSTLQFTVQRLLIQFVVVNVFFLITYCIQTAIRYKFWLSHRLGIEYCGVIFSRRTCSQMSDA